MEGCRIIIEELKKRGRGEGEKGESFPENFNC